MRTMRQKKYLFALLMLLAVFAACKGESPTAPTSTSGGGGGTTTPPTGSNVVLTVSNANPTVPSQSSIVTATVTQNGQPVPNGTAVEFTTDFGTFFETGTNTALRTTTNGVTTVTLTSSTAGKATIQAVVNNVARTTSVTFQVKVDPPCTPPNCPVLHPTITSVSPAFGNPGGGETVTINGTLFTNPVRVFFDFGAGTTPKEAFVVSRTDTQIVVTSPPVDLGTGQTKNATILVITGAGTTSEDRATSPSPFVYQAEVLTPSVSTVSPDSGPIDGGTRITIFGSGFQSPVQVSFAPGGSGGAAGWTAIAVVSVTFNQIIATTPPARDVNPSGSGTLTGAVDIRVRNINSDKEVVKPVVFSYKQKMQITSISPTLGTALGGTEVRIDGIGFNDPVTVDFAGTRAQVIRVSGTQVVARTGSLASPCAGAASVPVTVTNVDNGDTATSTPPQTFTYLPVLAVITSVGGTPPITVGSALTVNVDNPGVGLLGTGLITFTVGGTAAGSSPTTIANGTSQTFTVVVPSLTFDTVDCLSGGVPGKMAIPKTVEVRFTNQTTGCSAATSVIINPPSSACVIPPPPSGVVSPGPAPANCAVTAPVSPSATDPATGTATVTVLNTAAAGSQSLVITNAAFTSQTNGTFTVAPTSATIAPGGSQAFTVTVNPTAAGAFNGTLSFTSNNPASLTGCVSGTAAP
jgi:IPT/TIG domain/Abnormal spindle-like microcephaly-assoc'd, ASPM-SPD-2-Hydin